MESLPLELKLGILLLLPDLPTLKSFIITCRCIHDAFTAFRRQILESVLFTELGAGVMGIAVDTYFALGVRPDLWTISPSCSPSSSSSAKNAFGVRDLCSMAIPITCQAPATPVAVYEFLKTAVSNKDARTPQVADQSAPSRTSTSTKNCSVEPPVLSLDECSNYENGFDIFHSFFIRAQLRRDHLIRKSRTGRLVEMVLPDDEPVDIEMMIRTHSEITQFVNELTSSNLLYNYAASGKCSKNFRRMMSKPKVDIRRMLYGLVYAWIIAVTACEMVEGENDDDEMEIAFDVCDRYAWNLLGDFLADELAASGMSPGSLIILEIRYLIGLLDSADLQDVFTLMPYTSLLPNQPNGHLPEANRYRFAKGRDNGVGPNRLYKLARFHDM